MYLQGEAGPPGPPGPPVSNPTCVKPNKPLFSSSLISKRMTEATVTQNISLKYFYPQ